jgi:hypothetical protein
VSITIKLGPAALSAVFFTRLWANQSRQANQSKGYFFMSHILKMAVAGIMLAFAATGVAQARSISYQHHHFRAGYAGPVYSLVESRGGRFAWSAHLRDGYGGSRYWWGGDCWPTDPGGCDWAQ